MEDIHQKLSILHKIINELTQKPINIQQNILFLEEEMTKVYECILPLITISNNKSIPSSSSSTTTIASKPNCMKPPPKPSVLLSITEFRIIYTIMDILWSFQYHCYLFLFLESSSTTTINTESHPKSLLLSETQYHSLISILKTESQPLPTTESEYILLLHRIRNISLCMERIILHDLFSGFMIERNIKRLLICLVFFESFPDPISNHHEHTMSTYYNFLSLSDENRNDENIDDNNTAISIHKKYRVLARERLLKICCDGNFKSVVVTGLKTLSRGPPWLRHSGGKWFSQLLMSSDGLEAVLFAYLQGVL